MSVFENTISILIFVKSYLEKRLIQKKYKLYYDGGKNGRTKFTK
jgi:hypothetical protein